VPLLSRTDTIWAAFFRLKPRRKPPPARPRKVY